MPLAENARSAWLSCGQWSCGIWFASILTLPLGERMLAAARTLHLRGASWLPQSMRFAPRRQAHFCWPD